MLLRAAAALLLEQRPVARAGHDEQQLPEG
jgi:hypothetical protein